MKKGNLYLIPTGLGGDNPETIFPPNNKKIIDNIQHYIVENEKSARKFIKLIAPDKKQSDLIIYQLDKHDKTKGIHDFIKPLLQGKNMGLLSEAGLPAIADPGSLVVDLAHKNKIRVKPLVGPSSLMLALMGSGLNGQEFAFNGYLPKDSLELKRKLRQLENESSKNGRSQIFIETPYRNQKLLEQLIKILKNDTILSISIDLTLPTEEIHTYQIKEWKNKKIALHKRPAVFIFQAY
jgi:16S rRNA (cytidine1402-2'-O)-methyltransferase